MDDSDEALIDRHKAGDGAAFAELVRRHQRPIYFFALRMSGSPEDARELSQRIFLRAFRSLGGFEGRSSFRTWLFQIAANLCRNHHRDTTRASFVPVTEGQGAAPAAALGALVAQAERAQLRDAVEGLPPRQRAVLALRVYEDLSFKEIAQREGISEGNARVSYHLAVKALKATLDPATEEGRAP